MLPKREQKKIRALAEEGMSVNAIATKTKHSWDSVKRVLKAAPMNDVARKPKSNKAKIDAANRALQLASPLAPFEKTVSTLRRGIQSSAPMVRSFTMNIETGDVSVEVVQHVHFKVD